VNRFIRRRLLLYGAIAAALLVVVAVAIAAFLAMQLVDSKQHSSGLVTSPRADIKLT
jgi:hypothetical protein